MFDVIRNSLVAHFDSKLADELLAAYREAKRNFYVGGLRLSEVEGGRFCEAAFRLLEQATTGKFTGLNMPIDTDKLIKKLADNPKGSFSDSLRLHIPRALRVVYDVRNNRDAAHLADGIDPNLQDSTLVISVLDWALAEFVRLYHSVSADEAQTIVRDLVTRRAPAVQDFDGFLKVLKPSLKVSDYVLVLAYDRGGTGASYWELDSWVKPSMRTNLRRTLHRLVHENAYLHFDGDRYLITLSGIAEVESKHLHDIE